MSLTTDNQSKPHNMNIHEVLLAVVHSRVQPQDEDSDSELAGDVVEGNLSNKKFAKKATAKKPTAEGSLLRGVGRSTSAKFADQRMKSEEGSQGNLKSSKAKVNISRTSSRAGAKKNGPE